MEKLVITTLDETRFITSRFGKLQLTDNINMANVYEEVTPIHLLGYSKIAGEQLKTEQSNKFYTPFNF